MSLNKAIEHGKECPAICAGHLHAMEHRRFKLQNEHPEGHKRAGAKRG